MRIPRLLTLLLAAAVCLSFLGPSAQAAPDIKDVLKQIEPAVGIVWVHDQKGQVRGHGSGFFLTADGEFVTNRHVLRGAYSATIEMSNGKQYRVTRVLASHPELDMVKVKVETRDEQVPFLRTAAGLPEKGDRVLVYGNPEYFKFAVAEGIVAAIQHIRKQGGDTWIQFTAPVSHGNSGGPLINMNAEVVGIVTWGWKEGQNLNFALPIYELRNLVDYASGSDYAAPGSGLPLIPAAGAVQKARTEKPVFLVTVFAAEALWEDKRCDELINNAIYGKVTRQKYDVRYYDDVRSQLLKYLDSYGYSKMRSDPDLGEAPREFLTGFGRKANLDYILAVSISVDTSRTPGEKVEIRMIVKLLDVAKGEYLFYDVFQGEGRSYQLFNRHQDNIRAAYKALEVVMKRYETEVKLP
jgi:hypothetical protein